jgi:thiol-disulfide isomerase/thioredoxin
MIRRVIYLCAAVAVFQACDGQDPAGPDVEPKEPGYYIYADKTTVEADGKDAVTFTVKDQDDNIISTEDNMGRVWYEDVATGVRLERYSTSFSAMADGEFEYVGIYNGERTLNSVRIKAQNRSKYELFHKNVAIFKLTATWCPNCPSMTTVLGGLGEDASDHSIILACHNSDKFSVAYGSMDLAAAVAVHAGATALGLPTNVYDLAVLDDARTVSMVTRNITRRRISSPATSGVKVNSFVLDGSDIKVSASVKSSAGGEYDLTCAILSDGLEAPEGYAKDGIYDDVVIAANVANFLTVSSDSKFTLGKDQEQTKEFTFSFGENVPSAEFLSRLSVVVLALKKEGGKAVVDNAAKCGYGKTIDYIYN